MLAGIVTWQALETVPQLTPAPLTVPPEGRTMVRV
jgi:hypothetical protein